MIDLPTDAEPVRIIEVDCLDVLRDLPDGCVDAVVTDPPYPCIDRSYGRWTEAEWFALMNPVVEHCRRVLKPTGSAVFILQPNSERLGRMRTWLWEFMAKWGKEWGIVQDAWWWNNAALPTATAIQGGLLRASLKACVWLGESNCWRDQQSVLGQPSKRMSSWVSQSKRQDISGRVAFPSGQGVDRAKVAGSVERRGGVTPFNVLATSNGHQKEKAGCFGHSAGTPLAVARWWTRFICPPDGLVLDPFGGSGTMGLAAMAENRRAILIEREPAYCAIARRRVAEAMGTGLLAGVT